MKEYEKLTLIPVDVFMEGNVLVSSGEQSARRIDPINVTVEEMSVETIGPKTFDLNIE